MRIVHVITKGDVGGAQTQVVELAIAQATGAEVTIIAGSDGPALERAVEHGVATAVVPEVAAARSNGSLRRAYGALRDRVDQLSPDIVHGHSSHAGLLARAVARRLGVPSVYTAHGWPFQPGAPIRQRVASYVGESIGGLLGDMVICLTDAEAANARFVIPRSRIRVVPNGIADVPPSARRTPGVGAERRGPVGLVMVARFAPPKQQLALIEMMRRIDDLPWTLTFVGDGPGRPACERAAATLGDRVRFLGHRDDVPDLLAASDVGVLWSGYEGMPVALMEAMRAGLCCIANDLPGVRELLGGVPEAGIVAADEADFVVRVRELIADPAEIDRLGELARQRYVGTFAAEAMASGVRAVYDAVIARRR